MAGRSQLRSLLTEIATCPICMEDFKDPRSLPCLHSFCLQCLQGHCKDKCLGDDVPCPLCRKEFQIPRDGLEVLPHSFFLQELADAEATKHKPATSSFDPGFKEGRTGELGGSYCDKHPDKRLKLYCFDCRGNICTKCLIAGSHKHHTWEEIENVAKDFVAAIQSDVRPFPSRIAQFREAVKRAELANEKFLENVKSIEFMVQRKADEMKRLVDEHVAKLLQELDEAKTSSVKETKTLVEEFESALTALKSFEAYSSELMTKGSACDITRAADDIHVRAEELLKTYVTSGNYRPPDIAFVPTSVEKITGGQNILGSLTASSTCAVPIDTAKVPLTTRPADVSPPETSNIHIAVVQESSQSSTSATEAVPAKMTRPQVPARRRTARRGVETARQQYLQSSPQVIHSFPAAELVWGVTSLNNELYVLRARRDTDQVDVYSTTDFTLLRRLNVNGLSTYGMRDTASCVRKQRVYISDYSCIHRVGLDESVAKWPVSAQPWSLSVTRRPSCNILVTWYDDIGKLVELSSEDGKCVREITLQSDIVWPRHSIQVANNQFVVCHGDPLGVVSLVGSDGREIRRHSGDFRLGYSCHMAVDADEFVLVADSDRDNDQIVLLDPSLNYVRTVLEGMKPGPSRLCYDDLTRRLYVGLIHDMRIGMVYVIQL